ncbi:Potassium-transporting ATPase KdpC subunit [Phycisphaerales bacterium]|nr:Potassium-transporting ATPase KdpC subunit [Phycisphaerales bacterium]
MSAILRPAIVIFVLLTLITGIAYPLAVTGIAQAVFADRANGSLIMRDGEAVGSSLIGQDFSGDPKYFWGRLSATGPVPYTAFNAAKATGSSGSNLGPTNPALLENARARIEALKAADVAVGYARPADQRVPIDLVTSSASGLDPHVSLAAAEYQAPRVAKARGMDQASVRAAVTRHTRGRALGLLGEPVVNVLEVNFDLDGLAP